jgi:Domain of unknown function DUF11
VVVGGGVRVATANASFPQHCVVGPIDPVVDGGISKSVTPHTVTVGQRVAFKIRVFNNGSKVLTPSNALDSLAGHRLRVLSVRTTNGRCRTRVLSRSTRVSCSARTLAPGQAITINVAAQAVAPGTSSDTATLPGVPRDRNQTTTTRRRA